MTELGQILETEYRRHVLDHPNYADLNMNCSSRFGNPISPWPFILTTLRGLNDLRNHNFGHGMAQAFALAGGEVDFVYLSCISAILFFRRLP